MPGESYGRRCLVGYSPRGHKQSDTTERLHSLEQNTIFLILYINDNAYAVLSPYDKTIFKGKKNIKVKYIYKSPKVSILENIYFFYYFYLLAAQLVIFLEPAT